MIIDFHVHTFPDSIAEKTIHLLSTRSHTIPNSDGTLVGLQNSMQQAGIDISVNLPVVTNPTSTEKINDTALRINESFHSTGILSFGGMHPDTPNYREELRRLSRNGIKGIKIHPNYQSAYFDDIRYLRIMDSAAEFGLAIITHAGIDIGLPEPIYCTPQHVLHALEQVQPEKLILAHMGGWRLAADVEQYLCGAPVYFDTAYSLGSTLPPAGDTTMSGEFCLMDEADFLRIVRKHGADRILFATDSPWTSQKTSLEVLNHMPLTETEKEQIRYETGRKILGL